MTTTTLTTTATIVVAGLVVVAFILGKAAFGRFAPTLAVLAIGIPVAYGLGTATGSLVNQQAIRGGCSPPSASSPSPWSPSLIGAGIRASLHDTPHHCDTTGPDGRCVGCGQPLHTLTPVRQERGVAA